MALKLEDKKLIVEEVSDIAAQALSVVLAEYRGLTAEQMTRLRAECRQANVVVRVVKNTLARRALKGSTFECMQDLMVGPTVLAFSLDNPGAAARVFKGYIKENEDLVVKGLSLGGAALPPDQLSAVAKLPTRDEAIAQLMGVMKAPIEKLARTLAEPPAKLVRTVAAVRDQKEAA